MKTCSSTLVDKINYYYLEPSKDEVKTLVKK